ncbi:hypothetical protein [Paractinoplanes durhamensis]|uniref:hypothetical protein n=1 Tax=Paractinoplanes durhamensis TaxID=113563 RepID=UPI0031D786C5
MHMPHRARTALIWFAVAAAAVPLLWLFISSAGSREFVDPTGDARRTLNAAALVAFVWAGVAGTLLRRPAVALSAAGAGGAALLATSATVLALVNHAADFAVQAWGIALRGVALTLPGAAIGYAVAAVTRRLTPHVDRPPTGWVFGSAALLFMAVDALGLVAQPAHRLLTGPLFGWLAGDHGQGGPAVLLALVVVPAAIALLAGRFTPGGTAGRTSSGTPTH